MIKAKAPPRRSRSDERLDRLFDAIGKGHLDAFQRLGLESDLREIETTYSEQRGRLTAEQRKVLRKFRGNTERRQAKRRQLPSSVWNEVMLAGWLRENPDAEEAELRAMLE